MNRINSQQPQPRPSSTPKQMSSHDYMLHKNIPFPIPAKRITQDSANHTLKPEDHHKTNRPSERPDRSTMLVHEIERLQRLVEERTKEVELLRATECQNRVFSSQYSELSSTHQSEIASLQTQVQTYRQRTQDLKSQLEQYLIEMNRMNQRYQDCCRERDAESQNCAALQRENQLLASEVEQRAQDVEALRDRIQILENKHILELSQLNQSTELQRRSLLDTQIKEISLKFNQERSSWEVQKYELEGRCAHLQQENDKLQQRIGELRQEWHQARNDRDHEKQYLGKYEEQLAVEVDSHNKDRMKVVVFGAEIERLWCIIQDSDQSNRALFADLEEKARLTEQLEGQIISLKTQLQSEAQRSQQLQGEFNSLQRHNEGQWKQRYAEKEEQVGMLTTEIERLNQLVKGYNKQYNETITEAELISQENQQLHYQLQSLEQLGDEVSKTLEQERKRFQNELQRSEEKHVLVSSECERLRLQISELIRELQNSEMHNQQHRQNCQEGELEIQTLKDQVASLKQRNVDLNQQISQVSQENVRHKGQLSDLIKGNETLSLQLQNSRNQLTIQELELEEKVAELRGLEEQMKLQQSRHQVEIQDLIKQQEFKRRSLFDSQIRELTIKFNQDREQLEIQNRSLQQYKINLESKCFFLETELEKSNFNMNEVLQDKKQLADDLENVLKSQFEDLIAERMRIVALSAEIERLQDSEQSKVELYQAQLKQQQDATNSYLENIHQQRYDIEKLKLQNGRILEELEAVRESAKERETQQFVEIEDLYSQIETLQSEMSLLQKGSLDMSDLETKFQAERMAWETQRYQYVQRIQESEQRIQMLTMEIERWSTTAAERMREIENWKNRCYDSSMQIDYQKSKQQLDEQEQTICELESHNLKMKSQLQQLEKQVQLLDSQLQDKQREIEETYALMSKQRRQGEYAVKEAEQQRLSQMQQSRQLQSLETQLMQLKEQISFYQNSNQDLLQQQQMLEQQLRERDSMLQKKTMELNDRIKELDLMKDKYQSRITSTQQCTVTRNSSIIRKSEYQENQAFDRKPKASVSPHYGYREVMSQIQNTQFD